VTLGVTGNGSERSGVATFKDLGSFQLTAGAKVSLSNATYGDFAAGAIDIAWDAIAFTPSAEDLRAIAGLVDTGRLQVAISQVFPLEHAAKAHELSQSTHTTGKLVLSL